jgi:hypothetical protein
MDEAALNAAIVHAYELNLYYLLNLVLNLVY